MSHDNFPPIPGTECPNSSNHRLYPPHAPDIHVAVAVLQERLSNLEEDFVRANTKVKELEQDRNKALKWGIALLGSAVITLAGWIFKYFERAVS